MDWHAVRTQDFDLAGAEAEVAWSKARCFPLQRVWEGRSTYRTEAGILYSASGIYFRFECEDKKITATYERDFENLFEEDVVEIFIWPDETRRIYFEYEISPLGKELPLLIPNPRGDFMGWLPWHYEGARAVRKHVTVSGGPARSGAEITGWVASCFIPFELLKGVMLDKPEPGSRWRVNLYRIDYDELPASHWVGSPVPGRTFHAPEHFGTLLFV